MKKSDIFQLHGLVWTVLAERKIRLDMLHNVDATSSIQHYHHI
jgi:hypothetical protein